VLSVSCRSVYSEWQAAIASICLKSFETDYNAFETGSKEIKNVQV